VMMAGAAIYQDLCSACHNADGTGVAYLIPSLAGASSVASREPTSILRVVIHGAQSVATAHEPTGPAMPAFGWQLSDAQIAGIKDRLKLTSSQQRYWPPVETALRAVARKIHAKRQSGPGASDTPIDPDSDEVQQLKSAAMPLLLQLREDQKNEVRSLARIIGLDKVAAMI